MDSNCRIDYISVSGIGNEINLNQNCSNVRRNFSGIQNIFKINGNEINNNNLNNFQNMNNYRVITIASNYNNGNGQNNFNIDGQNLNMNSSNINADINNVINQLNNFGINFNNSNNNANNSNNINNNNADNFYDSVDEEDNNNNLSEFEKKKRKLILEMNEFQYKHIVKYDSRKETECSICLAEFLGTDVIKAFYKCEHIFHKKCLLGWLKKADYCPLCKHNLKDDMAQI